MIFAAHIF